eukprot:TRINITY_DN909_c0_g2_i1.p1 TRINITY_DN909_c0_g2~~TRINITY_DN909_c0_g2_i1.p1  ORF type:complete len:536 (+),score=176.69 TRINITY_DN909_c0_g2_i1:1144-2751(+)
MGIPRHPLAACATAAATALATVAAAALFTAATGEGVNGKSTATWTDVTDAVGLHTSPAAKWGGGLIADLDGDGWYDLVLNNHDQTTLQLFWNNRDGGFTRAPDPLPFLIDAHGMAAGDVFLTGSSDFIVMQGGANGGAPATPRLLRSSGRSRVLEQAQRATMLEDDTGGRGRTPLLVDMDRDGDLDLILLNYVVGPEASGPRQRVYENRNGVYVRRNDSGLENANVERAILTDLNGDGWMDVVAFPFLRIYIASSPFTFVDHTDIWMRAIPDRGSIGTSVWAAAELDANGDGMWDLYLARRWQPDVLLLNAGNSGFAVAPPPAGPLRGFSDVTVGDFNNDGATDVFLSYAFEPPAHGGAVARPDVLLTGNGHGGFTPSTDHGANQVSPAAGDSVQAFDYNLDGRLDLLIAAGDEVVGRGPLGTWSLFDNTSPLPADGGGHWLLVDVGRSVDRRAAPGNALVTVTAGYADGKGKPHTFMRRVGGAGGSGITDDLRIVHFGLGDRDTITELKVTWSDGSTATRTVVPVDTKFAVTAV